MKPSNLTEQLTELAFVNFPILRANMKSTLSRKLLLASISSQLPREMFDSFVPFTLCLILLTQLSDDHLKNKASDFQINIRQA